LGKGKVNRQWISALQPVIKGLNSTPTRMIGMSPDDAVKKGTVVQDNSGDDSYSQSLPVIKVGDHVRYLLQGGEHETGSKYSARRATDPIWSLDVYEVVEIKDLIKPAYYYLDGLDGHKLREQLQLVSYIIDKD